MKHVLARHSGHAVAITDRQLVLNEVEEMLTALRLRSTLKCGIAAIDLRNGQTIGFLEFQAAVEEIFDVQILPRLKFPEIMGFQKEALDHTFVIPHRSQDF